MAVKRTTKKSVSWHPPFGLAHLSFDEILLQASKSVCSVLFQSFPFPVCAICTAIVPSTKQTSGLKREARVDTSLMNVAVVHKIAGAILRETWMCFQTTARRVWHTHAHSGGNPSGIFVFEHTLCDFNYKITCALLRLSSKKFFALQPTGKPLRLQHLGVSAGPSHARHVSPRSAPTLQNLPILNQINHNPRTPLQRCTSQHAIKPRLAYNITHQCLFLQIPVAHGAKTSCGTHATHTMPTTTDFHPRTKAQGNPPLPTLTSKGGWNTTKGHLSGQRSSMNRRQPPPHNECVN